jgi:WD40 repeat protein
MPRIVRIILTVIPLTIVIAAIGVWIYNTFRPPAGPTSPEVQVQTKTIDGITFEAEYETTEAVKITLQASTHDVVFSRRGDILNYLHGLLTINDIGLPDVKPGDTVRWNLSGPVLYNGKPQEPHPLQPTAIEAPSFDATWDPQPSSSPRDTLSLAWAGTSRLLVVGHGDGVIRVWDADQKIVLRSMTPDPPKKNDRGNFGLRIAVSPNGKQIAATNMFGDEVTLWDQDKATKTASLTGDPKGNVRQVEYASDDTLVEARGGNLILRSLDKKPTREIGTFHEQMEPSFTVNAKARLIAWHDGKKLHFGPVDAASFEKNVASAGCLAFNADGTVLAEYDGNNRLSLYDTKTGNETRRLRWRGTLGAADGINALAFAPDGLTLAVGSSDSIRFYDVPTGRERGGLASPWVRDLAYSADGRTLAAALRKQPGLRLWNTADLVVKKDP